MTWLYYFLFIFFSNIAFADPYLGPMSRALAGGGRAGLESMEAGLLNPALIPLVQASEMSVIYGDGYSGAGSHETSYGLGIMDATKEVYFPASAHFIRSRRTGLTPTPTNQELWHVAAGKKVNDWLVGGVSVYRIQDDVENDQKYSQWNYSLGVLTMVHSGLGFAYVLSNMAKPGSRVPTALRQDLTQAFGAYAAVAGTVKVRGDLARQESHNPDHKLAYSLSLESMTSKWILFRLGYRRDERLDQKVWTTGFEFHGPRLKLDYAFEKTVEGTSGAVHSVDLRVPF